MKQQNNQSISNETMQDEMNGAELAALADLETQDAAEIKGGPIMLEYILLLGGGPSTPQR